MNIEYILIINGLLLIAGSQVLAYFERKRAIANQPRIDAFVGEVSALSKRNREIVSAKSR